MLTVADTGPGLAADELPHAFERFFLYSRYARNRAVGTGLGLAIVKELTEAMDGTISVKSVLGQGHRLHRPAPPGALERRARRGNGASFERFFVNVRPSDLQVRAPSADA